MLTNQHTIEHEFFAKFPYDPVATARGSDTRKAMSQKTGATISDRAG